jgi:hypothetical protein
MLLLADYRQHSPQVGLHLLNLEQTDSFEQLLLVPPLDLPQHPKNVSSHEL